MASTAGYTIYGEKDLNGLGVMFALKEDPKVYELPKPAYNASIAVWDSLIRPLGAVTAGALLHYLTIGPKEVEPEEKSMEGGE
jgi:formate dehydrogenase iron-sulfur subunit